MILICSLLIGLIAVSILIETESSAAEQTESIPVPVRVNSKR